MVGSQASSLVTRALTVAPLELGVGKVSLLFDFVGGSPTVCREEIYKACSLYIKPKQCAQKRPKTPSFHFTVYHVLISGVCVRRELIFPYFIFVIFKLYVFAFVERPCAVSDVSRIARE